MKKHLVMLLVLLSVCVCVCGYAEDGERTIASYEYALTEDGAYVENLIFNADVVISGDHSQIVFSNCEFAGDIILTASEGTKVMLLGCDISGACVVRNGVTYADLEYSHPKFLTTSPISVICEDGACSTIALGDFEVTFNGQTYTMADSQFFGFLNAEEYTLVPYEGQEASYFVVAKIIEGDEESVMVICEFDPTM